MSLFFTKSLSIRFCLFCDNHVKFKCFSSAHKADLVLFVLILGKSTLNVLTFLPGFSRVSGRAPLMVPQKTHQVSFPVEPVQM